MRSAPLLLTLLSLLAVPQLLRAGDDLEFRRRHLAGRVFVHWGYNRSTFTTSNIHLRGPGYDFILHDVRAADRPEPFSFGAYFKPANIWIPQYNYRVGWFMNEHWSFSLGLDHMKYVVRSGQTVRLTGTIDATRSVSYAANTEHDVVLRDDLLRYEHTDGLNLLSADVHHYDRIWSDQDQGYTLHLVEGLFVGPVIPRTDVRLFGEGLNNKFHLAGYGAGGELGVLMCFPARITLRAGARAGYIELPDVLTTGTATDRASQHFWFLQGYAAFGVLIGR